MVAPWIIALNTGCSEGSGNKAALYRLLPLSHSRSLPLAVCVHVRVCVPMMGSFHSSTFPRLALLCPFSTFPPRVSLPDSARRCRPHFCSLSQFLCVQSSAALVFPPTLPQKRGAGQRSNTTRCRVMCCSVGDTCEGVCFFSPDLAWNTYYECVEGVVLPLILSPF